MVWRKGDVRNFWVFGIIAIFVLIMVLGGFWKKIEMFVYVANLIPGFNQTAPEGTSIVGVNLENNKLMYFTGEKWREIETKNNNDYFMGSYSFKPQDVKKEIQNFYFNTKREPEKLNMEVNSWRYWEAVNGGRFDSIVRIYPRVKKDFETKEKIVTFGEYIDLNHINVPNYGFMDSISSVETYTPLFAKIEYEDPKNAQIIAKILVWKDSILKGNSCEKFLELNIRLDKKDLVGKNFTARRVDNYLFVDLNEPASDLTSEKYKVGCFEHTNYEDKYEIAWDNPRQDIRFSFKSGRMTGSVLYDKDGWRPSFSSDYGDVNEDSKVINSQNSFYENILFLVMSRHIIKESFGNTYGLGGLFEKYNIQFNGDDSGNGVFLKGGSIPINIDFIKGVTWKKGMKSELRNKFLYHILTEYYKDYKIVEKEVVVNGS
ncbi:hypothetical protein FJZ21_02670 [Candidatus Pacearchaeota archaeon]|nr:hypothetical protein [Candidatus Pacearchaeota archaeon]